MVHGELSMVTRIAFVSLYQLLIYYQIFKWSSIGKRGEGKFLWLPCSSLLWQRQAYDPHLEFPVEYRNPSVGVLIDSGSFALHYFSQKKKLS